MDRTPGEAYISEEISIDGNMDEAVWETADVAQNFWQFFPTDTAIFLAQYSGQQMVSIF